MTNTCETCKSAFDIPESVAARYRDADAPLPFECSSCLMRRELAFFAFGKFRKSVSALSGEKLITIYPENVRFPVYASSEWHSDAWEAPSAPYDPSRPFFEQFGALQAKTPRPHQTGAQHTRCEWCDDAWYSRDCYLSRSFGWSEFLSYAYRVVRCRDSLDIAYSFDLEQCYDCTYCFKCFNTQHAFDSRDSMESMFLYDCRNVEHCFMCWNLRNKSYCIRNRQYAPEEYARELASYGLSRRLVREGLANEFEKLVAAFAVHKPHFNTKAVDSEGNYLTNCRRCNNAYAVEESEDCANVIRGHKLKDVYDSANMLENEKCLMCSGTQSCYDAWYSALCLRCRNIEYCDTCVDCEDCFGCVGLRNKKFCILNAPYAEGEYRTLVATVKDAMRRAGEYGRFFPYALAYTGYNLSAAQLYFPETREKVMSLGGMWTEIEAAHKEDMNALMLPDRIEDVSDDIAQKALACAETEWRYNIAAHELTFLKRHGIPAPTLCPDARFRKRFAPMTYIAPRTIACCVCGTAATTYWPEHLGYQKIACEACYLNTVR